LPSVQPSPLLGDPSSINTQSGDLADSDTVQPPDLDTHHHPVNDLSHNTHDLPSGDIEDLWLQSHIHLDGLKLTADFVKNLQQATLDDPSLGLSAEALERLCNPLHEQPCDAFDRDTHMVIELYEGNPSEATYKMNCMIILHHFPGLNLPSYYKVK
jgi:hypothetical protein